MNSFKQTTANYTTARTGKPKTTVCLSLMILFTLLFAACQKQEAEKAQAVGCEAMTASPAPFASYKGLNPRTYGELLEARIATARYQDINKAFADGYADINVIKENMGYHL